MSKKKTKPTYWIMRYASSRGTDTRICVALPAGTAPKNALEVAKDWAGQRTAGTACQEYTVTVRRVRVPNKVELQSRWTADCKRKNAAVERWNDTRAMLNAYDWSRGYTGLGVR